SHCSGSIFNIFRIFCLWVQSIICRNNTKPFFLPFFWNMLVSTSYSPSVKPDYCCKIFLSNRIIDIKLTSLLHIGSNSCTYSVGDVILYRISNRWLTDSGNHSEYQKQVEKRQKSFVFHNTITAVLLQLVLQEVSIDLP